MFAALTSSSPLPPAASQPLSARRKKLQHAEQRFARMFPRVPLLGPDEAQQLLQTQPERVVLVDCRTAEEQQVRVCRCLLKPPGAPHSRLRCDTSPPHRCLLT
jgi:hypothetical protein